MVRRPPDLFDMPEGLPPGTTLFVVPEDLESGLCTHPQNVVAPIVFPSGVASIYPDAFFDRSCGDD